MKLFRRLIGILIVGALVAGVVFYVMQPATTQKQKTGGRFNRGGDEPVPVLAAAAQAIDVPVYFDGVGTTRALNTVTVRAQIDGKLMKINFKEGQEVKKGDVLAEIEATTYQAQVDQAVAKKAQDEAQLANARLDLDRYVRLALTNAGNKQQADAQRAQVAQLEAQVRSDQGAIDNARAILSYTKVTAPLAGRTGLRQVDEGNIVHASDATGIVVITQVQPIAITFTLPQQQLAQVNKAATQGTLPVESFAPDNKTVTDRGTLSVVDNQIDPTTGTVKLKAEFPNASLQLWPGQFVNVRLLVDTLKQVVVVPTAAVQRGPTGTFVYVVKDDTAAVRPVTVTMQDDTRAVIASGLQPGEQAVTNGFARLADGTKITVSTGDTSAPPPPAARPPGERRKKRGDGTAQSEDGAQPRRKTEGVRSATP